MRKSLILIILQIFNLTLKSQVDSNIKLYDKNYYLIDFKKKELLNQYDFIYIDTAIYAFSPVNDIPDNLFLLPNLKTVSFSITNDSVADKIFKKLSKVKKLEGIEISGNNFNLDGLIKPNQYHCLSHIPKEINGIKKLKTLKLNGHFISNFTIDVKKLKKLESIELFRNKLEKFPIEICNLSNIKVLGLENNFFDTIPPEICNCKTLAELMIGRNSLKSVPLCLFDIDSLKEIFLNENLISNENINHYREYIKTKNKQIYLNTDGQINADTVLEIEKGLLELEKELKKISE